jgi:hypothetical protein
VGRSSRALEEAASQARGARTTVDLLRYPPEDMHGLAALLAALPER